MRDGFNRWFYGDARPVWRDAAADLPALPGAYLLACETTQPVRLPPRFGGVLPAGCYVYAGSARGPGGIRARGGRHLRRGKAVRWHIDWITECADTIRVLAVVGGDECALAQAVAAIAGATVPVAGFGSSDCRRCPAHLLAIRDPTALGLAAPPNPAPRAPR